MTYETKHTPTPYWYNDDCGTGQILSGEGDSAYTVAYMRLEDGGIYPQQDTDAAFIVRACNRDHVFDELVAALASIAGHAKEFGSVEDAETMLERIEEKARAALAKARGEA